MIFNKLMHCHFQFLNRDVLEFWKPADNHAAYDAKASGSLFTFLKLLSHLLFLLSVQRL